MKLINELELRIMGYLGLDKRHLKILVQMIISLLTLTTVNLSQLAKLDFGSIKVSSRYRKLQRFFSTLRLNYRLVAQLIFHLFEFETKPCYLTLDRTNWSFGCFEMNILFLCIEWQGCAIPILWLLLPHAGNSSTHQRIALLKRFVTLFGKASIKCLLADREFIGHTWFSYLKQASIPFCIRIKKDADTRNARGQSVQVGWLFHHLGAGESYALKDPRLIYGHMLFISAARSTEQGELMIVVSHYQDKKIEDYLHRWPIECLFACLKSKGFQLESTRLKHRARLKKLIALVAISYCWAIKTGLWRHYQQKMIRLKNHGRKACSFFRYGLDYLQEAALKWFGKKTKPLKQAILLFEPHHFCSEAKL